MKLVFWAGIGGDEIPVKTIGRGITPVKWCKLHWVPTDEDCSRGSRLLGRIGFSYYQQPKWLSQLYSRFTSLCIPETGYAYAVLTPIWGIGGFDDLRKSLDALRLQSLVVPWMEAKRDMLITEIQRNQVSMVFAEGSWQIGQHYFLITRDRMPDLERLKESVEFRGFDYDLLSRLESIVCNYHEHGIEVTSIAMTIDDLKDIASRVSSELNIPLEIEENLHRRGAS